MSKSLLVLSFSNLDTDPRVSRHLDALSGNYRIVTCGWRPPKQAVAEHVVVDGKPRSFPAKAVGAAGLLLGSFERFYWSHPFVKAALRRLEGRRFDGILANDLLSLPLALRLAKGAPLVFDAHEYSPEEMAESPLWRLLFSRYTRFLCAKYLPRADARITVCEGIAEEYSRNFGVSMAVVDNASSYWELAPRPTAQRLIRIIHHGAAMPARKLERMIEMMDHVDERYTLDFMLMAHNPAYLAQLKRLAARNPRIAFRDPVAKDEIVPACAAYDVGVYLLEPLNFNHQHALPNKIFEFMQARLALMIGPSPEMARIVNKYGCGVVAESFAPSALANALNRLSSGDIDRLKARSDAAARVHHAESNAARLREIVAQALARGAATRGAG